MEPPWFVRWRGRSCGAPGVLMAGMSGLGGGRGEAGGDGAFGLGRAKADVRCGDAECVDDLGLVEPSGGDKLAERVGGPVEGVVAGAWACGEHRVYLVLERGEHVRL